MMENLTLYEAESNLRDIVNNYNDLNRIKNEAETRFHLIDEIIEKCFGWDKSQITVERYMRYYVAVAQRPKFKQNHTKMPLFR